VRGDVAEAERHLERIRAALTPLPSSYQSAGSWLATAETLEHMGDADGAVEAYERALACAGL
jgi:Tfp pilus assembly protein PilF